MPPCRTTDQHCRRRYWLPALSKNPDTRSIQVGLIWTCWSPAPSAAGAAVAPKRVFPGRFVQPGSSARTYEVELAPDAFLRSPAAPMHSSRPIPTRITTFRTRPTFRRPEPTGRSASTRQGQHAAHAKTEGKKDFRTIRRWFQAGWKNRTIPAHTCVPGQQATAKQDQTQKKLQVPLSGFIKSKGDNADTFGTESVKLPEPSTGADKYVAGDQNTDNQTGTGAKRRRRSIRRRSRVRSSPRCGRQCSRTGRLGFPTPGGWSRRSF